MDGNAVCGLREPTSQVFSGYFDRDRYAPETITQHRTRHLLIMRVYRISKCRFIEDLSGYGAAQSGGRWNSPGVYILYASESPALALLENIVNNALQFRMPFCQITLDLPVSNVPVIDPDDLPPGWNRYPSAAVLKAIGDSFVRTGTDLAIK